MGSRIWVPSLLAAAALCALLLVLRNMGQKSLDIAAEPFGIDIARRTNADAVVPENAPSEKTATAPQPAKFEKQTTKSVAPQRNVVKAPPSLEEELAGMQRARATLARGDAAAALAELNAFERDAGFRKLSVEATLLRIEVLAQAGKTDEARAEARRFVEKNPNNPLVDRAKKFARPPASPGTNDSVNSEPVKTESE
jgi:hypothetical protein